MIKRIPYLIWGTSNSKFGTGFEYSVFNLSFVTERVKYDRLERLLHLASVL